jgi:tetratricopeptide (TPR) repeat protein
LRERKVAIKFLAVDSMANELDPNFSVAHEPLGRVYLRQQKYTQAIAEFEKDIAVDRTAYSLSNLGYADAVAGKRQEALSIVKELEDKYNRREALGQYLALVYLGEIDQTLACWKRMSNPTLGI